MSSHNTKELKHQADSIFLDKGVRKLFTNKLPNWLNYGLLFISISLFTGLVGIFIFKYSLSTDISINIGSVHRNINDSINTTFDHNIKNNFLNKDGMKGIHQIDCEILVTEKFASKLTIGDPIKLVVKTLKQEHNRNLLGYITHFNNAQRDHSRIQINATFKCKDSVEAKVILKEIKSSNVGTMYLPPRSLFTLFTNGIERINKLESCSIYIPR